MRYKKENQTHFQHWGIHVLNIQRTRRKGCITFGENKTSENVIKFEKKKQFRCIKPEKTFPKQKELWLFWYLVCLDKKYGQWLKRQIIFWNVTPITCFDNNSVKNLNQYCSGRPSLYVHPSLYRALKLTLPLDIGGLFLEGLIKNEMCTVYLLGLMPTSWL